MTKRNFQKIEYDAEHRQKENMRLTSQSQKYDISVSLTEKQWWAIINHILNDLSYHASGYSEDILDNAQIIINEIRTRAKLEYKEGII